ncbi:MAG: UDP-N-acetylmuramoyl-tripeptide--D-alanyl-D-alanine ligase [Betaproteobacteria bacterium]|nr:UDP-N-acetylmuramoyl-tripeptide--D-alanyl-D-alanine ligase [Betaproteobacteria bacterium]
MSDDFAMTLSEIAQGIGACLIGADASIGGVSTDTRTLQPGDLFVAIKGDNFDGHEYLARALEKGAAAALVSREIDGVTIPQLLVDNTRFGYGRLARLWRGRFNPLTLALTGSNGKTTVKEMLRSILLTHTGDAAHVLATEGNLNNDIGLPQMMLRLRERHRYAVFEMGMNHLGEIEYLSGLLEPDVAMVTMAGTAHIGELGSREAIAQAKGEIYSGLKPGGIAVMNMHDRFGAYWRGIARDAAEEREIIGFGISPEDEVVGTLGHEFMTISSDGESIAVRLQMPGEHNQRNALAAAAGAIALGVPLETIKLGLESFAGVEGRLRPYTGHNSATIVDDTYNANPDSVKAAIRVLAAKKPPRVLVLGDMGELGVDAPAMHREVGEFARDAGIERLYALGELSRETVAAFGKEGVHFVSRDELVSALLPQLDAQTTVLVKGSRFMKMERVVEKLVPNYSGGHH